MRGDGSITVTWRQRSARGKAKRPAPPPTSRTVVDGLTSCTSRFHLHVVQPMGISPEKGGCHLPTIDDALTQACLYLTRLGMVRGNAPFPDLYR